MSVDRRTFLALCAGSLLWPGVPELNLHTQMVIEKHKCDAEYIPMWGDFENDLEYEALIRRLEKDIVKACSMTNEQLGLKEFHSPHGTLVYWENRYLP